MNIARELNRSQKTLERALGNPTFTWFDGTYPCTTTAATASKNLNAGGFSPDADLILFVRAELFDPADQPESKEKLTYRAKLYRIEEVVTLPGDGLLKLVCMDANRKA
jgi:hypothetical protein